MPRKKDVLKTKKRSQKVELKSFLSLLNRFLDKIKLSKYLDITAFLSALFFAIIGAVVSINRYWQYEVFYYNFGVFDQAIWHISRFQPPIIEHLLVGGKISLADHFDLSILLLAPIFWITERSEALLVIQALFAGMAGFIIYKIGVSVLKDKLIALSISACYFLFVGIQNAVITDFHELTVMSFPITLTFWAIVKKRIKLFWLFFAWTLGFKEVTFLLGIGIGIFIFFYNKKWWKHAVIAAIISALWGYLTIYIVIPYFSQGIYLHKPDLPDSVWGKFLALFDHPSKRETVFYSLLNFGFLPIFTPSMWFVIAQDYVLRYLPKLVYTRWTLGLHYNAQVAPLLAISSIFGFYYLQRFKLFVKVKYLLAVLLILSSFYQFRFIHHGPFLLFINPVFYEHTNDFKFLDDLVKMIPKNASVMTQNNLGVRFTHQKFIYLRLNYDQFKPEYVLIDARDGQNPNNFLFSPKPYEILEKVKNDANYKMIYHKGDQFIFKRLKNK